MDGANDTMGKGELHTQIRHRYIVVFYYFTYPISHQFKQTYELL